MADERKVIRFTGEYVSGQTGESTPINDWTRAEVVAKVKTMRDGDALVINATEREFWS
jgi:hypothetical protein